MHNPYNILGVEACRKVFPRAKQIAVFDTEFFAALPVSAATYPLPELIRKKYGIKKFGFHGISHEYSAKEGARLSRINFESSKIITCHLGGGASITAIKNGKAIDTSMGFTPMEGLVMMTRSGSIDPGVVLLLSKTQRNASDILNYESGVKGICGLSDMREVLEEAERGSKKARLALDIFVRSAKKYIGAYCAVLGGCDLLVFTGAIGHGSAKITSMVLENMPMLKNAKISFIKPDEELAIAQKIKNLKI